MTFVMQCMVSPFGVDRPRCFSVLRAYCLLDALHLIEARSLPGFMESVQIIIGFVISLHATGLFYSARLLKDHTIIGLDIPLHVLGLFYSARLLIVQRIIGFVIPFHAPGLFYSARFLDVAIVIN